MKQPNKVLAITNNFPTAHFPEKGVFVMNILKEMYRQGVEIDVIAPVSFGEEIKRLGRKPSVLDFGGLNVKQPYSLRIPKRFSRFRKTITRINDWLFGLSLRVAHNKKKEYDFVYCHFFQSTIPALLYLPIKDIPLLVNIGESNPWHYELFYSKHRIINILNKTNYIITVSKVNYNYIQSLESKLTHRMRYIPNGVNLDVFKPYERLMARKKLGLDLNAKYIVFCGHFIERKGPLRILDAIKGTDVKGIFIGSSGPQIPVGREVAFVGGVNNEDIVYYLNACDAFVLPSLSEGMSNAVLEAMACCAPMVISNLPFNTDFVPKDCAMFIDPSNIKSIKEGIFAALNSGENRRMRNSLLLQRDNISIETRIKRIFNFLKDDRLL